MGLLDVLADRLLGGSVDETDPVDAHAMADVAVDEDGTISPATFESEAAELADFWAEYDLDYTAESLRRLDDLVQMQWSDDRFTETELGDDSDIDGLVFSGLVVQIGSYFGEVLRRQRNATWHELDGGWAVVVEDDVARATADVFGIAAETIQDDRSLRETERELTTKFATAGALADGSVEAAPRPADQSVERRAERLQRSGEDLATSWPDYDLDFEANSLARLDDLVATEWDSDAFAAVDFGDEDDPESLVRTAMMLDVAGYFATVFRRTLDAEWTETETGLRLAVRGNSGAAHVDPVGVAAECVRGDDSFAATYEAVRGRLSIPEE
jgi:hypothetical protein